MPLIEKHTHGGFPASEAWCWNEKTSQKLGSIIYNLMSTKSEEKKRGYIDYYEFKRHFIAREFQNKIKELEKFRKENNNESIHSLLETVRLYFLKNTTPEKEIKHMESRIVRISYSRVKNIGNYENCRVEAEAEVVAGEKPGDVMKKLRAWVENQAAEPITDND